METYGTYSITLAFPPEIQSSIDRVKDKYIKIIMDKDLLYIVATELNKNNVVHYHIYYNTQKQKTTSNETKKFNECYEFDKKTYPKAILHRLHKDPMYGIGYAQKDNNYKTNFKPEYLTKCMEYYTEKQATNNKVKKLLKNKNNIKYYNVNEIADLFLEYAIAVNKASPYTLQNVNYDYFRIVKPFMATISGQVKYSTYCKVKLDKLWEYWLINKERLTDEDPDDEMPPSFI